MRFETKSGSVTTTIRLPDTVSSARPVVSRSGMVVYQSSTNAGSAIAVEKDNQGFTRVMAIIPDRASKHSLAFSLDGFTPYVASTGEAVFIRSDGFAVPVNAPWAKDSRGTSLQTYYEVQGNQLVQVVVPSRNTVYPITADPSWGWYNGWFGFKLTRGETQSARTVGTSGALCFKMYPAFAAACAGFAFQMMLQANLAEGDNPKTCLFVAIVPMPISWRVRC